jgi:type II secretory pathway pseudopilin PulG
VAAPPQSKAKTRTGLILVAGLLGLCLLSVPCLAAIAIPSFVRYVRQSRVAEAESNLRMIYLAASSYYVVEQYTPGAVQGGCATSSGATGNAPASEPTPLGPVGPPFAALGVQLPDPVYHRYEIEGVGGCGHGPGEVLYTFRAVGDLDGDGAPSVLEMTASVDADRQLTSGPIRRSGDAE